MPDPESIESEDGPLRHPRSGDGVIVGNRSETSPLARGATRLLLTDEGAGRVVVQWQVERRDLQLLQGVFPSGVDPTPVIQLIRLTGQGPGEPFARAVISDAELLSDGQASFDVFGGGRSVHAELGLETPSGGWLLLVRSAPVSISAVNISTPPDVVPREFASPRFEPALAATGADLIPVFPEVAVGTELLGALRASFHTLGSDLGIEADSESQAPSAATDLSVSDAVEPDWKPDSDLAGPGDALADDGAVRGQQAIVVSGEASAAVSAPNGAALPVDQPRSSSYGISEPRYDAGGEDLEVHAALLVHGRAKPGSEIDLFGHLIQIGPGGRFSLHLPISNSELLQKVLDQGLPLAVRRRPLS